ncbi:hypothetical protein M569_14448 [Genlisea aurea]|uniref:Uncharacterized protein n=1 Tax=Genlisea aurea TaxID=192259 RepID=S8C0P9_9LAMI|nr:hypothetical protein M569_14448 [Genlisea aurea]
MSKRSRKVWFVNQANAKQRSSKVYAKRKAETLTRPLVVERTRLNSSKQASFECPIKRSDTVGP